MSIFRSVLAVVISVVVFGVTVGIFDGLAGVWGAMPPPKSIEEYKQNLDLYPKSFFLIMMLGWSVATALSATLAAAIAAKGKWIHSATIGSLGFAMTLLNLSVLPHPTWVWLGAAPLPLLTMAIALYFRRKSDAGR